jgi:hypothetical protein
VEAHSSHSSSCWAQAAFALVLRQVWAGHERLQTRCGHEDLNTVGCCCARVRNAVCEFDCTLDIWGRPQSGHGPSALWPGVVVEVSLSRSLAKGSCWHSLHTRSHHECNCYLIPVLAKLFLSCMSQGRIDVHSGFASSHFFFRFRHVPQPVLVRLANCLFLFLASRCWTAPMLRSAEFP